jgi:hypothetical protein
MLQAPLFTVDERNAAMRLNCWQVKKCGREPGGTKVAELGVCPAAAEAALHGTNGGKNGGCACWAIAGTLCGGKTQGSYAAKMTNCAACEFYQAVKAEEGSAFERATVILAKLR